MKLTIVTETAIEITITFNY